MQKDTANGPGDRLVPETFCEMAHWFDRMDDFSGWYSWKNLMGNWNKDQGLRAIALMS